MKRLSARKTPVIPVGLTVQTENQVDEIVSLAKFTIEINLELERLTTSQD